MEIDYKQAYLKLIEDILGLSNECLSWAERAHENNPQIALTLVKVSNKVMEMVGLEIANLDLAHGK
jgi:hypothetical protein